MKRQIMLTLAVGMFVLTIPVAALAEASIVQLWCDAPDATPNIVEVHFSVINYNLPEPVCGFSLMSEPYPPAAHCTPLWLQPTPGWTGSLNAMGGADWVADAGSCIGSTSMDGEFIIALPDPDESFCCYVVQYLGAAGNVLLEQEECFYCAVVPSDTVEWGSLKSLYR